MRNNRRFCNLPNLSLASPREFKNTDKINDTMVINWSESDLADSDFASTAYLFQSVQSNSRRRYRVFLSLVSTMTLIATAVAVISVTVKKMSSKSETHPDNQDDGLWFNRNTQAPGEEEIPSVAPIEDKDSLGQLFSLPPVFSEVQVTAPPAITASPNQPGPEDYPNKYGDTKPSGPLFDFPPISTIRTPFPTTLAPSTLEPSEVPSRMPINHDMKRPSYLDLTSPPFPPTPLPSLKPTRKPTDPIKQTEPPRMPTVKPTRKPTQAPFSPFLDIVMPVMPPSTEPEPTNSPSKEAPTRPTRPLRTPRPTRRPRTQFPTEEPVGTSQMEILSEEPSLMPTLEPTVKPRRTRRPTDVPLTMEPTMKPRRTSRPTDAPVTMVPTSKAPVTSTLAPIVTTPQPTDKPTKNPTPKPTPAPVTDDPTSVPTTNKPTEAPRTPAPTKAPTTSTPTASPTTTAKPTPKPTAEAVTIDLPQDSSLSFRPGELSVSEGGLKLSTGLTARMVATSGQKVVYSNGEKSSTTFHHRPDAGAAFPDTRAFNPGGWVYVSNSEMRTQDPPGGAGNGGVGALTFDADGNVLNYDMILSKTTWNCGGGRTPWNTWVSCEESPKGVIWQVDPMGGHEPEKLTMGSTGGKWESFAYDISDLNAPHFFVTEDHVRGALIRFTPAPENVNWQRPWKMLHGNGTLDYLHLTPNAQGTGGTFEWTPNRNKARTSAEAYYPNCEGIDSNGESLFFVSKRLQQMFELNLRDNTFINLSTVRGLFDGRPDQITRILANSDGVRHEDDILYFTEEGGVDAGVHGRGSDGRFFTILEGPDYKDETSGLSFSPDGKHLYIAYQENGILFDVQRNDGHPFHAKSLNVKYHAKANA